MQIDAAKSLGISHHDLAVGVGGVTPVLATYLRATDFAVGGWIGLEEDQLPHVREHHDLITHANEGSERTTVSSVDQALLSPSLLAGLGIDTDDCLADEHEEVIANTDWTTNVRSAFIFGAFPGFFYPDLPVLVDDSGGNQANLM